MARPKKEKPNRNDGRYEVKLTIGKTIDGTPIRKSFYSYISKEDAKKQADEYKIESEVANRTGAGFIDRNISFEEWAYKWLEVYKKPDVDEKTYIDTYRNAVVNHILPFFKRVTISQVKAVDIKAFYETKTNMSASSLSKIRLCLNGIFETAVDNDICYKNPCRGIKFKSSGKKIEKHVYTDEQIEIVKSIAEVAMPDVALLLDTGLRRGELVALMWDDIDFENNTISVNRSVATVKGGGVKIMPPKWNSYRINPLSPYALKVLQGIPKRDSEYIFPTKFGTLQSPNTWSQKLNRFMKTLPDNIPRLTAHELRHTYGTSLRRNGIDIYTIQKVMGHKDIKMTTEIYVHNEIDVLRKSMNY